MSNEFRTVAIVGRVEDPRVAEPMAALAAHLTARGVEVLATPKAALPPPVKAVPESGMAAAADLIVAIGGDGTMLYAASLGGEHGVPLLGINRGRLGFLADVTPDEMMNALDQVLGGEYVRESRLMLSARVLSPNGCEAGASALNDVVLQRRGTGRMVDCETRIGDRYVNTHSGDGLIIATPTGSTAYALSCGGPIIDPALSAVVLVPICPHTLSDRPVVVPSQREIEVRVLAYSDSKAEVMVDGHLLAPLDPADRLLIREADHRITLIHPPGYDYFDLLRSKLHWGRDSRQRAGNGRS